LATQVVAFHRLSPRAFTEELFTDSVHTATLQFPIFNFQFSIARPVAAQGSDIPFAHGVFYEVGSFSELQFIHNIGAMMVYGADADIENFSDLAG